MVVGGIRWSLNQSVSLSVCLSLSVSVCLSVSCPVCVGSNVVLFVLAQVLMAVLSAACGALAPWVHAWCCRAQVGAHGRVRVCVACPGSSPG